MTQIDKSYKNDQKNNSVQNHQIVKNYQIVNMIKITLWPKIIPNWSKDLKKESCSITNWVLFSSWIIKMMSIRQNIQIKQMESWATFNNGHKHELSCQTLLWKKNSSCGMILGTWVEGILCSSQQ